MVDQGYHCWRILKCPLYTCVILHKIIRRDIENGENNNLSRIEDFLGIHGVFDYEDKDIPLRDGNLLQQDTDLSRMRSTGRRATERMHGDAGRRRPDYETPDDFTVSSEDGWFDL